MRPWRHGKGVGRGERRLPEELAAACTLTAHGLQGAFSVTAPASFLPLLSAPPLADVHPVALLREITKPWVFNDDISSVEHFVEHFQNENENNNEDNDAHAVQQRSNSSNFIDPSYI